MPYEIGVPKAITFRVNITYLYPMIDTLLRDHNGTNLTLNDLMDYCVMAHYCELHEFQLEEELTNCILPEHGGEADTVAFYEYCCNKAAVLADGMRKVAVYLYPHLDMYVPRNALTGHIYNQTVMTRRYIDISFTAAEVL